jgi:hypothetical protein
MVPVAVVSLKMIRLQPLGIANYAHIHSGWLRGRQLLGLVECAMRSDIEQSYETSALANLSKAFQATWEVLHARDSSRDADAEDDHRLAVSGKLLALAADGLTDPEELRDRVLQSLSVKNSEAA